MQELIKIACQFKKKLKFIIGKVPPALVIRSEKQK
jgi:hypothetical protein